MGTDSMMIHEVTLALTLLTTLAAAQDCPALPCDVSKCKLPDCFCSGNETRFDPTQDKPTRPQIVYLTFDDAVTAEASTKYYDVLFGTPTEPAHTNPNGCAIRATHFVTHQYNDYSLVNKWWHYGHEIASHSITHRNNQTYWEDMDMEAWKKEIVGQRRITGQFAALDPCELKGWRSPFLQGGGDTMYGLLAQENFKYDCTWPTRKFGYTNAEQGLYPYTLDYKSEQDCQIEPCPTCSHPGLWVQPMIDLEDEWIGNYPNHPQQGNPCSMLDACTIIPHDEWHDNDPNQVYYMLMKNFNRTYRGEEYLGVWEEGNRAPWGLYMHAAWFFGRDWHFRGYKMFIDEITSYPDVWVVPIEAGISYMEAVASGQYSMTNEELLFAGKGGGPFACKDIEDKTGKYDVHKNRCGPAKSCRFENVTHPEDNIMNAQRYMTICTYNNEGIKQNCPDEAHYPWLETEDTNPCGGNIPCKDCVL